MAAARLRVSIDGARFPDVVAAASDPEATMRICGEPPSLGAWDPKRSPRLERAEPEAPGWSTWEAELGALGAVEAGTEFKCVVLVESRHEYVWESLGPLHRVPRAGSGLCRHVYNDGGADSASAGEAASVPVAVAGAQSGRCAGYPDAALALPNSDAAVALPKSATGGTQHQLRVEVPAHSSGDPTGVVCGESEQLGRWDVKRAPLLKLEAGTAKREGTCVLTATVVSPPGTKFKYVLTTGGAAKWEEARPNRKVGSGSGGEAAAEVPLHVFDSLDPDEEEQSRKKQTIRKAKSPSEYLGAVKVSAGLGGGRDSADLWLPWGGHQSAAAEQEATSPPRSVFHAFNMQFDEVRRMLKTLSDAGFDAVQISPAQKSAGGGAWWGRYQPKDYSVFEGLGDATALKNLCAEARALGVMVIGDVVFNHMLVVAGAGEWERAQKRPKELEALKARLSAAVGPALCADDFQWPWVKMSGENWDNEHRYESWGNGEWSELRHSSKVVGVHTQHLRALLDAGVRGFRFDAVKHMRAAHVAEYSAFLRQRASELGQDVYAYGEVLSVDEAMQLEYMEGPGGIPTTDFALTAFLRAVLGNRTASGAGWKAAARAGVSSTAEAAASGEGVALKGSGNIGQREPTPAALRQDSVRFARNHDTVMNSGSFYGLGASCLEARLLWAFLLAVHDGTVLVFPEDFVDASSGDLIRRGLLFRRRAGRRSSRTQVCLRGGGAGASSGGGPGAAALVCVTLRNAAGAVEGVCLLNATKDCDLVVTGVPSGDPAAAAEGQDWQSTLAGEDGDVISVQGDGTFRDDAGFAAEVLVKPWNAVFLARP